MKKLVRNGIVAVAGTVALGGIGFAATSASATGSDPVAKREDTATSWTQQTDADDDLRDDNDDRFDDSPTNNTVNTVNTQVTKNTAPTKNTPTNNTPTNNTN